MLWLLDANSKAAGGVQNQKDDGRNVITFYRRAQSTGSTPGTLALCVISATTGCLSSRTSCLLLVISFLFDLTLGKPFNPITSAFAVLDDDSVLIALSTQGAAVPNPVPVPAALPLFATGLSALGLIGWRRKRKRAT